MIRRTCKSYYSHWVVREEPCTCAENEPSPPDEEPDNDPGDVCDRYYDGT